METSPIALDLEHILMHTEGLWQQLAGERLFVTGGTGFFGRWLLESFAWANQRMHLKASAVVLTRDPTRFQSVAPHLTSNPFINWIVGDVRDFTYPAGTFSYVIHAATESSARLNAENPLAMMDTIIQGTRHTLDFACQAGVKDFLLTSSGAVYGRQPPELTQISEDYLGGPDSLDPRSAYGEGKRTAELLCSIYAQQDGLQTKIARCFAFVGPFLPLDIHFAIGNFIRDGLRGGPIQVQGDGTPFRSYLYSADLAVWLWSILLRGVSCRPYNVGSPKSLTIAELANLVSQSTFPRVPVIINKEAQPGIKGERYIPSIERAQAELQLEPFISLGDGIKRTIGYYSGHGAL
jgi:nucleoside-diphosphate-sugar epimerase